MFIIQHARESSSGATRNLMKDTQILFHINEIAGRVLESVLGVW